MAKNLIKAEIPQDKIVKIGIPTLDKSIENYRNLDKEKKFYLQ